MQHSHEALDRPGGFARINLLAPLRHRDFRLLWTGMTISLFGDGIFLVAMAWQVYALWNAPAALSIVGIAMTCPTIVVPAPRRGRQRPLRPPAASMLAADVGARRRVAGLAALALDGPLKLWDARRRSSPSTAPAPRSSRPAFDALVPDILPARDLAAANALDQFVRPIALRLVGPGARRLCSSRRPARASRSRSTPARSPVSGVAVLAMRPAARTSAAAHVDSSLDAVREGFRFVRSPRLALGHAPVRRVRLPRRSSARPRCCCPTS